MDAILKAKLQDVIESNFCLSYGFTDSWSEEELNNVWILNTARVEGKLKYHESYESLIAEGLLYKRTGKYWDLEEGSNSVAITVFQDTYCYITALGEEYLVNKGIDVWD